MSYDYEKLENKKNEIIGIVHELFTEDDKTAISLVDSFCRLTPPEKEKFVMEYITVNSLGRRGGKSRKLGNFVLNWRELFNDLPDLVLTAAGVAAEPKLIFFAALSIWNKIWCHSSIELTPEHATVLYVLWQGRDESNTEMNIASCVPMIFHWLKLRNLSLPIPNFAGWKKRENLLLNTLLMS